MKYMGSKARLSKNLAPIINRLIAENNIEKYIEPFVGGGNLIQHIDCKNKVGADNNQYLISMWKDLLDGWLPPKYITRDEYNNIKDNKEKYNNSLVAVAGFCATYNAKWFGGYAGIVETKSGKIRNYYDESVRNIMKQLEHLQDVVFLNEDYSYFSKVSGALIYCDPPYEGVTKYGKNNFNHETYWDWVRKMSKNNIVLCSEYNAPEDFVCIFEKKLTTTLDKNSRKTDTEKLFVHKNIVNKIKDCLEN